MFASSAWHANWYKHVHHIVVNKYNYKYRWIMISWHCGNVVLNFVTSKQSVRSCQTYCLNHFSPNAKCNSNNVCSECRSWNDMVHVSQPQCTVSYSIYCNTHDSCMNFLYVEGVTRFLVWSCFFLFKWLFLGFTWWTKERKKTSLQECLETAFVLLHDVWLCLRFEVWILEWELIRISGCGI